jgi:hypothetical protein
MNVNLQRKDIEIKRKIMGQYVSFVGMFCCKRKNSGKIVCDFPIKYYFCSLIFKKKWKRKHTNVRLTTIPTLKSIIIGNYACVDKTRYIEMSKNESNSNQFSRLYLNSYYKF